jgi:hypothetical protein
MSDPREVSGVWYGRYVSTSDNQDNGFIAMLEEAGGVFRGASASATERVACAGPVSPDDGMAR